jgi:hypothetical protein
VFGKQSNEFLNSVDGNFGIASVCLSYLSFECFNDVLSTEDIGSKILSGDYVLFTYAADEWLEHIRQCARRLGPEPLQSLRGILSTFAEVRENYLFQSSAQGHHAARNEFQSFQTCPDLYELLIHMDSFMRKQKSDLLEQDGKYLLRILKLLPHRSIADLKFIDSGWVDQDPSTVSFTRLRIRRQLEAMLCPSRIHAPSCHCQKLLSLYGRGLFKCDRLRCQYYRVGFDTRSDRDSHLRIHNRPFKCPEPNCEFADIGFISERDLSRHRSKTHRYHLSGIKDTASKMTPDQFKPEELKQISADAIEADEVEFVRSQYLASTELGDLLYEFVFTAAKTASPAMVDLLLEECALKHPDAADIKEMALCGAIRGENMVVIKHLITRGANVNPKYSSVIRAALDTYNPEIVEILLAHGAYLVECSSIFHKILMSDPKREEDEVFKVLHRMHKYVVGKDAFSSGFLDALWRGSVPLAKYFIDNGADVKMQRPSVLYQLVRKYSRRHVEAIKFLLQQGVDPYPSNSRRQPITSLAGMRKVEQYFEKSWDDLVSETQAGSVPNRPASLQAQPVWRLPKPNVVRSGL